MHSRSTLSRPSPKRSLSCAGLDDFDALFQHSDTTHLPPNRKRHQSLTNDNNFSANTFATASHPQGLRRPELYEKSCSSGDFQLVSSTSSHYPQTSCHHSQASDYHQSSRFNLQNNNDEENNCNNFEDGFHNSHGFATHEPQDVLDHRFKLDHDVLAGKRLDQKIFLPPSHRSSSCECSPREEFLVQAFGTSGFKLNEASVSSSEDFDDSLSDESNNNDGEHDSSSHESVMADAEKELKMSLNELENDIHGALHEKSHHDDQQTTRLPEFAGLSHQSFALPSHGPLGLDRNPSFVQNNQDLHNVSAYFTQSQDTHSDFLPNQSETGYFSRQQHRQCPSHASHVEKTQSKRNHGVQAPTKWLRDEDERLRVAVASFGGKNWKMIAETLGNGRTDVQCLHRWNKVLKPGLIKGPWTPEEDRILTSLITRYGVGKIRWCDLALHLPGRIGKQCRERWCNHLDSRIRKGQWTPEEDDMVFCWQQKLGNKWSEIAKLLPGRTENAVKNRFNSAARRKWLMNQANGCLLTPSIEPQAPHLQHQQQHNPSLQSNLTHDESSLLNVNAILYGGEKVAPLPSTAAFVDHQSHKTLGRPRFIQPPSSSQGTAVTSAIFSSGFPETRSTFCSALINVEEQGFPQQVQTKPPDITTSDLMPLTSPLFFVSPRLDTVSVSSRDNIETGATRSLAAESSDDEASVAPIFPFPAHVPAQEAQHSVRANILTADLTSSDVLNDKLDDKLLLPLEEEKTARDDGGADTTMVSCAATDPSVAMDDDNMKSFLDSVALELDDIIE